MYANQLAIGRNHYTADTAKLYQFNDCARAELHWNDGAMVSELFDERKEAIEYLEDHGFALEPEQLHYSAEATTKVAP